jgi:hypothetical protein
VQISVGKSIRRRSAGKWERVSASKAVGIFSHDLILQLRWVSAGTLHSTIQTTRFARAFAIATTTAFFGSSSIKCDEPIASSSKQIGIANHVRRIKFVGLRTDKDPKTVRREGPI